MFWRASGVDSSSDDGRWSVVVEANRRDVAIRRISGHLLKLGRTDLEVADVSLLTIEDGIVSSNVESRC